MWVTLSHKCLDSFLWGQTKKFFLVLLSGHNRCNKYVEQSPEKETHKRIYPAMCYPPLPRTLPSLESFLWLLEAILKKKLCKEHKTSRWGLEVRVRALRGWREGGGTGKVCEAQTGRRQFPCLEQTAGILSVLHLACASDGPGAQCFPPDDLRFTRATFWQQAEPQK